MHLSVHPTVFHPRYFVSSESFANFIAQLDLRGKRVVDVGTGTGILAIAAAHAGSEIVIATDINPNAALSVRDNALRNGAGPRVTAVCMDLLSGFVPASDIRCDHIEPTKAREAAPRLGRSRLARRTESS